MDQVWGEFPIPHPRPTSALGASFFSCLVLAPAGTQPAISKFYIYDLLKVYFEHIKLKLIKHFKKSSNITKPSQRVTIQQFK